MKVVYCIVALLCMFASANSNAQIITNGDDIIVRPDGIARKHALVHSDGGPMLRVTHPRSDSLRDEIAKLRKQLDEMTKQLKKIEGAVEDSARAFGWSLNSNGDLFGPDGLLDSNYFHKFRDGFDLHGNRGPLHEFRFKGKKFIPRLPNFEYRIPAPSIPHVEPKPSTPAPDFPGWRWQWLGGKET